MNDKKNIENNIVELSQNIKKINDFFFNKIEYIMYLNTKILKYNNHFYFLTQSLTDLMDKYDVFLDCMNEEFEMEDFIRQCDNEIIEIFENEIKLTILKYGEKINLNLYFGLDENLGFEITF